MKGILSIAGQPGLFKIVSEGKNSIIVESLLTGKRIPAYASAKISALDDIAIFTVDGDKPLREVFETIKTKEEGGEALSHKSSGPEIKAYFKEIVPDYDEFQVYTSDMKKVLQWYNLLHAQGITDFSKEDEATEETPSED